MVEEQKQQNGGPVEIIIPEVRYLTCHGCKWYQYHEFEDADEFPGPPGCMSCEHPDIGGKYVEKGGMYTPKWCPYIK